MKRNIFLFTRRSQQKNNHRFSGFTLIECLVSLMILSLMCLFFSTAIRHVVNVTHHLQSENERMWHIFLIQLEHELKNCQYQKIEDQAIVLINQTNQHQVQIVFKKGKIIKVDNGGYQPLLMNVKEIVFKEEGKSIYLTVFFENQVTVSGKWHIK